jgi:phosphatidylinositol-3-phosphatase
VSRRLIASLFVAFSVVGAACGASLSTTSPTFFPALSSPLATDVAFSASSVAAAAFASASPASGTTSTPESAAVPAFRHVYVIVLENKEYGSIVGNPAARYLNRLNARYASLTQMYAETHPSEPNYFALFSGSTQGATDDGTYTLAGANLVDQLIAHGKTWRVFAQNVPPGCYTGSSASGGEDGSGAYARKHEPAISFQDISGNPSRCAHITDFLHFSPAAADFELIIPNLCNDMHDCSVGAGDAFLAGFVPRIIDSPAFASSVLFITFDEGASDAHGGGHIATLVVSPLVRAGSRDAALSNHFTLLRTIEDAWGLGCLHQTCSTAALRGLFVG